MVIYHIVLPEIWDSFDYQQYEHASLSDEGFIHCSFEHQLEAVIERYYSGAESIVVLSIETDRLTSRLKTEPSTGGELYPHIYGPINGEAIVRARIRELGQ